MALRPTIAHYPYRGHRRIVDPTVEPVTAAELRTYVRADLGTLTNEEADLYIAQARSFLEETTGLAFVSQKWRLTYDSWPGYIEPWWDGVREMPVTELARGTPRALELPRYPLISVTDVKVYDEASTETAVNIAQTFDIDIEQRPGRLGLKFGETWPLATRPTNAVLIEYTAGFGTTAAEVPPTLRAAVLHLAAYLYDHRGECDMTGAYAKSGARDMVGTYSFRSV